MLHHSSLRIVIAAISLLSFACSSSDSNTTPGQTCTNVTACGGDVVGTWNATSSCITVSGNMDMTMLGLGCTQAPITGTVSVTGSWTANADGTYTDNTTTSGNLKFQLEAACLNISGTVTTCDRIGDVIQGAAGFNPAACTNAASGTGCDCTATVQQSGSFGAPSPSPAAAGNYTVSGNSITLDTQAHTFCVAGTTLTMSPTTTLYTTTGKVDFQKQ